MTMFSQLNTQAWETQAVVQPSTAQNSQVARAQAGDGWGGEAGGVSHL